MDKAFLTPKEIMAAAAESSRTKLALPTARVMLLGMLAGADIGLGAHLYTTATTGIQDYVGFGLTKLIGGGAFSLGLVLVVMTGAELFTGNMLHVISLLNEKTKWKQVIKAWLMVYGANLLGSLLMVGLIFLSGVNGFPGAETSVGKTAVMIATAKSQLSFAQVFVRGILANWLVCLAIVLALSARDVTGKILGCMLPITAFVAMGFEHSVANMYFLPAGKLLTSAITGHDMFVNLTAATAGNMLGGIVFVWLVGWLVFGQKE